ncbi:PVC-type heme-binding CxxCH protein [Aureliella helgolandensis]|uniref:Cytochrome c n=1 Tax=Aureliella helgolandensis TaxID=2527968 RepID=A0A518G678_9BACT|nr:PVC-type heme-binding CxxCH protein [Aureliella helgolandensis]QDV24100.1 Cytochrome c [Aureliella helgolandensis]
MARNCIRTVVVYLLALVGWLAPGQSVAQVPFPEIYNSEPSTEEPISPEAALAALSLPDGFTASLFAAEPQVQNPIATCVDGRGRVWVAENYTYAERSQRFDLNLNDRVVVHEDVDGDGVADSRVVFTDSVQMLTGIVVGRGGVWLMCPPQLLFVPDANDDLLPDGVPQVVLDGFHVARENYHNFANGLSWGPDGWLYGRCGASCPGELGIPGCLDADRIPIRGGIWRYHPQRHLVEALTQGTTNPWGHDWNALGELFFINTVNGHLWHMIPGAHYVRPHTLDANPYSYELIDMHADHWHFDTGKSWTQSRDGAANDFGGGHAHIGMLIYQEETWPQEFQGDLFTINMHGRRWNREHLQPQGSGYVGVHAADMVFSDDPWFRGMDIKSLPDGNVLLIDWSDTGECHDSTGVHRTSGRIFKISHESPEGAQALGPRLEPLRSSDLLELARLQVEGSTWQSRRARERTAYLQTQASDSPAATEYLRQVLRDSGSASVEARLRALWGLQTLDAMDGSELRQLLGDDAPAIRVWAIRLLTDLWPLDTSLGERPARQDAEIEESMLEMLSDMARRETAAEVRLALASTLQRLPLERRAALASNLVRHVADAGDHNLPLMVWYGLMPLGDEHLGALLEVLRACEWPTTRRLIARRIAEQAETAPQVFEQLIALAAEKDSHFQADIVAGVGQGVAGRRQVTAPKSWQLLSKQLQGEAGPDLRSQVQNLNILFGDGRTIGELKSIVADRKADLALRKTALQTLVDARAEGIVELTLGLLNERFLNSVAAQALARETSDEVGDALVKAYGRFHPSERSGLISILSSRPAWSHALLEAVADGAVDRTEISPFQARQIAGHGDPALDAQLLQVWGQVRVSSAEKQQLIAQLKQQLTNKVLAEGDKQAGRALFEKSCIACHQLFGAGGQIGPDLTGAQRSNLDFLLENIIDPSAVVTTEFRATLLMLEDGRVLTGLLTNQSENSLTLATQEQVFTIPTEDVIERKKSNASTMPEGLLSQLSPTQIRDLFAYLQSKMQVPLQP